MPRRGLRWILSACVRCRQEKLQPGALRTKRASGRDLCHAAYATLAQRHVVSPGTMVKTEAEAHPPDWPEGAFVKEE
eukprot:scaffold24204_cov71-Phaeocystis_antarctica.AAC.1